MDTTFVSLGKGQSTAEGVTVQITPTVHTLETFQAIAEALVELRKAIDATNHSTVQAIQEVSGALFDLIDKDIRLSVDSATPIINVAPSEVNIPKSEDTIVINNTIPKIYLWGCLLIPTVANIAIVALLRFFAH